MAYHKYHGGCGTRLYKTWKTMRCRILSKTDPDYPWYGGRGITICSEWDDFAVFRDWALSNGYDENLTIERKDVNGNYCADNCTFITIQEQAKNRRNNTLISAWGETKILNDWLRDSRCKASRPVVSKRIKDGWSTESAISTTHVINKQKRPRPKLYEAFGESKRIVDWAKDPRCKVTNRQIITRMSEGWSLEDAISTPKIDISRSLFAFGEVKTTNEWAEDSRCNYKNPKGILQRIKNGMSPEDAITIPNKR